MTTLLKYENAKLKSQLIWSIPASMEVCGMECSGCYAIKAQKQYPSVSVSRESRYRISRKSFFPEAITAELYRYDEWLAAKEVKERTVRIHEAGEFYSEAYIKKWINIAKDNPKWTFYGFTKRMKEFKSLPKLAKLKNVHIIDSLFTGVVNYNKTGVIANKETGNPLFICPSTTSKVECHPDICKYCYSDNGASVHGVAFKQH